MNPLGCLAAAVDSPVFHVDPDQPGRTVCGKVNARDFTVLALPFEEGVLVGDERDVQPPGFGGGVGVQRHLDAFALQFHHPRPVGFELGGFQPVHHVGEVAAADAGFLYAPLAAAQLGVDAANAVGGAAVAAGHGPADVVDPVVLVRHGRSRFDDGVEMCAQAVDVDVHVFQAGAEQFGGFHGFSLMVC